MKKGSIIFILILCLFHSISQDKVWLAGGWPITNPQPNYGITKRLFTIDSIYTQKIETNSSVFLEGCNISISRADSLLFYSNGLSIFNRNHDTMLNSQGFNQYPSNNLAYLQADGDDAANWPQMVIALPDFQDTSIFHLFHSNFHNVYIPQIDQVDFITYHIDETIVDMKADNGKGAVTSKNIAKLSGMFAPAYLTACRHGNGKDWWILIPEYKNNTYQRVLFSETGFQIQPPESIGSNRRGNEGGIALFSPDGTSFAISNADGIDARIRFFDFDRCRGLLSNPREWVMPLTFGDLPIGISFSYSGRFLYAISFLSIWQYDTWATDIEASKIQVAQYDGFICMSPNFGSYFYTSQLAPNNEIWIASTGGCNVYHVIRHPDSLGIACQVEQHAILNPSLTQNSIPIYPNYHLGALPDPCPTVGIEEETLNSNFVSVYPNPANNRVHVYLDKAVSLPATFSIFDPYGREVHQQPLLQPDTEIPLGGLVKGMYIYEVITDNYKSYGKLWVE